MICARLKWAKTGRRAGRACQLIEMRKLCLRVLSRFRQHVNVPAVLTRRMAQIGLVEAEAAAALQAELKPGQRLVSLDGDLWRWDGFRAWAEDAPSAAALRLEQMNRLEALKQQMEAATSKARGRAAGASGSDRAAQT